jgi:hypothetical protein
MPKSFAILMAFVTLSMVAVAISLLTVEKWLW